MVQVQISTFNYPIDRGQTAAYLQIYIMKTIQNRDHQNALFLCPPLIIIIIIIIIIDPHFVYNKCDDMIPMWATPISHCLNL